MKTNATKMRKIKPHKGGRTEIIPPCRVTPEEKSLVDEAREDLSYSDFIVGCAKIKLKHTSRQKAKYQQLKQPLNGA